MDTLKKSRIPTRVRINSEKSTRSQEKENITAPNRGTLEQTKSSKSRTATMQKTSTNVEVLHRHRILSDTALLPPEKKLKIVTTLSKGDESSMVSRLPLGNLDKNIASTYHSKCTKPTLPKSSNPSTRLLNRRNAGHISPIKPHMYAATSVVIFQGIPEEVRRPAKKISLMHKIQPRSIHGRATAYCLDVYNTDYLEDIIRYQLQNDWKYILRTTPLQFYDPCSVRNRAAVVNWLIRAQDYLDLPSPVLFTTIRLFDSVLEKTSVACNMCQLVGLVIMWIISKFEDNTNYLTTSKMLALCNGVYSTQDFLNMEKKLLKFFGFDLNIPDVTTYATFYIKKLNTESDLLLHCALYILECYALTMKFSMVIPSIQAAAAVRLALSILHPLSNVWQQLEKTIGYYSDKEIEDIMQEMLQQLHKIQDPAYDYRQPYHKYAAKDKIQVSIVLLRELVAT